jgi:hypothetical protein
LGEEEPGSYALCPGERYCATDIQDTGIGSTLIALYQLPMWESRGSGHVLGIKTDDGVRGERPSLVEN